MLDVAILTQPNDVTCGPTCLQAIYQYHGDVISLDQVIKEVPYLETGGTLAILLGCHALMRGYQVHLHSFNLDVIDPTWFKQKNLSFLDKLNEQLSHAKNPRIFNATKAYIKFFKLGGQICFEDMNSMLIRNYLDQDIPLLSGVSATYLYKNMRDYTNQDDRVVYDEWQGEPSGHFVILRGYDNENEKIHLADPYAPHPLSREHYYSVSFLHWLHAFLLGYRTFDAELLAIQPRNK